MVIAWSMYGVLWVRHVVGFGGRRGGSGVAGSRAERRSGGVIGSLAGGTVVPFFAVAQWWLMVEHAKFPVDQHKGLICKT